MKERPIIFNSDEVRAILDGRKTIMRRVIKPQPYEIAYRDVYGNDESACFWRGEEHEDWPRPKDCPYGVPGDRLWVKETWRLPYGAPNRWVDYKADDARDGFKWCSPVRMPRWASRIMLEIVSIRVERLQDISEEDALAEGIRRISHGMDGEYFHFSRTEADPKNWCFPDDAFRELWDSINAKRSYRWDTNPWVWVIWFKRVGGHDEH